MVQIKSLTGLALAASAFAGPITSRQSPTAASVQVDLNAIDAAARNFTSHVNAYTAGANLDFLIPDFIAIEKSYNKTIDDVTAATPFSASDSVAIVKTASSGIGNDIPALVTAFEHKKAVFTLDGEAPVVISYFGVIDNSNDKLFDALSHKLTADVAQSNATAAKIRSSLVNGIVYYSVP